MSRIGKKPIQIPAGVQVKVSPDAVEVKGPKGTLRQPFPSQIGFAVEGQELIATPTRADKELSKFHGLSLIHI